MLTWVEEGLRASMAKYCELRGLRQPERLPYIGPRGVLQDYSIESMELDSGHNPHGLAISVDERWWSTGIGNQDLGSVCKNVLLQDLSISGGNKWASRSYRMGRNNRIDHVAVRGTWPEHDIYWNLAGYDIGEDGWTAAPSLVVSNCYFQDTGSQNIQLVQRAVDWYGPTPAADLTPGGPIFIRDSLSRNAGIGGESARASFAISLFASKNNAGLLRVMVDKSMQPSSRGCLLVEKRPRCVVDSCAFFMGSAEQPIAIFRDVDDLTIINSFFQATGGQNWISIEGCRKVTIEGCSGTAHIHDGKADIGPVATGLVR